MNQVYISGGLVRDPELRATTGGTQVCEMRVAVSGDSRSRDDTVFCDIVVFGKRATAVGRLHRKGSIVLIIGHLRMESWEGSDGQKRSKMVIVAEEVATPDAALAKELERMGTPGDAEAHAAEPPAPEPPARKKFSL